VTVTSERTPACSSGGSMFHEKTIVEGGSIVVQHALRSAVTRGHKDALTLLGYGQTRRVSIEGVGFTPKRVRIGGRVAMTFGLKSTSTRQQQLLVDVACTSSRLGE